jgi:hypothetical protein
MGMAALRTRIDPAKRVGSMWKMNYSTIILLKNKVL